MQTAVDLGWPASPSPQADLRPVEDSDEVGQEMRAVGRTQQSHGEKCGLALQGEEEGLLQELDQAAQETDRRGAVHGPVVVG